MTLWRYILRGFLFSLVGVLAVLFLVVALFTGVDYLRRYGDSGAPSSDIVELTLLNLPEILYQISPLIFLLGSLACFLKLARTSELVVMRAAGISALRLIGVPVMATLVLGAILIAVANPFVAATMRRGEALEEQIENVRASILSVSSEGLWLRQADGEGQAVIQAARANSQGTILSRVRVHRFDGDGLIFQRIDAPVARLTAGAWRIENATVWQRAEGDRYDKIQSDRAFELPTELTRAQILDSFSPPEMISFWDLPAFIAQIESAGFSGLSHRLYFQTELARPVLFSAMVLIGAIFALRPARFGQTGVMILIAILAGFSLYFLKDFAELLGAQGQIPLLVAAWAPSLAAILFTIGLLLHLEDG